MGVVDFQAGFNNDLRAQLLQRAAAQFAERKFAEDQRRALAGEAMQQRVFESNEGLKNAQLESLNASRQAAERDRQAGLASSLADQIPAGQFVPEADPVVGMLRTGGRGSLLNPQEERPAVETGPLLPGDTGAARAKGFIKTSSAKQQMDEATRQDKLADNERAGQAAEAQIERDAESARHNKAMEGKQSSSGMGFVVVQTPNGYEVVDKKAGTSKPITSADGGSLSLPPTSQERNTKKSYERATPILNGISDLSERINVNQGIAAKAIGETERQKAKLNLNDDVAEYEAMISGFTPLIARSLGHTGVLTEQDVQSVKALFPRPGDSKSLRDRKVARIKTLMGQLEGNGDTTGATEYDFVNGKLVPRGQK